MLRLSSTGETVGAIERARRVEVSAYMLHDGPVVRALEDVARRGARVSVRLDAKPYGAAGLGAANRHVVERLRRAGVDAALQDGIHAKSIAVDGTVYLDGRNWGASDFVVRTDRAADVAQTKRAALVAEADTLAGATCDDRPIVQTESFGTGNEVYNALAALAKAGVRPRLLVSSRIYRTDRREQSLIAHLESEGADVRVCDDSEKFAVAGSSAWVGSANATFDLDGKSMSDWGVATNDPSIVAAARTRVESVWQKARTV
jgi:phosphatidylserine/phosphatidylglycerophosphate/cardiolipin synthase-like enzyme